MPNESDIQEAVAVFLQGDFKSERACATHFGVARSTLKDRLRAESHKIAHSSSQKLSIAEENELVQWILSEELAGTAVSYARLRDIAEGMLKHRQPDQFLGQNGLNGFKNRHPEIIAILQRRIEAARYDSMSKEAIQDYFSRLSSAITKHNIQPANI